MIPSCRRLQRSVVLRLLVVDHLQPLLLGLDQPLQVLGLDFGLLQRLGLLLELFLRQLEASLGFVQFVVWQRRCIKMKDFLLPYLALAPVRR